MVLNKQVIPILLLALAIAAVGVMTFINLLGYPRQADASVTRFAEYNGTTTSTGRFQPEQLIQSGAGTLGSIVITGAAAGTINIYDATTSDITKRTGNVATSSILVASMPVSAAAGTYTFDELLTNGLYVSVIGTMPTTTITSRAN